MSTLLTIGLLFTVGIICFFWGAVTEHRLKMKDKKPESVYKRQMRGEVINTSELPPLPVTKPPQDLYQRQKNEITKLERENEIEKIKKEKRILCQMSLNHFNSFLKERGERIAAQSRIKDLEAALARAEGLNRSFAEGGIVNSKRPAII